MFCLQIEWQLHWDGAPCSGSSALFHNCCMWRVSNLISLLIEPSLITKWKIPQMSPCVCLTARSREKYLKTPSYNCMAWFHHHSKWPFKWLASIYWMSHAMKFGPLPLLNYSLLFYSHLCRIVWHYASSKDFKEVQIWHYKCWNKNN